MSFSHPAFVAASSLTDTFLQSQTWWDPWHTYIYTYTYIYILIALLLLVLLFLLLFLLYIYVLLYEVCFADLCRRA